MTRKILSLDTATKCGYAIYSDGQIIESGMKNFTAPTRGRKLSNFKKWLFSVIEKYNITEVVAEDIFYNQYTISAFKSLGEMRGMIHLAVEEYDLPLTFIEPYQHKYYLCGTRCATKQDTLRAIRKYGYNTTDTDEGDAIAILLTHIKIKSAKPIRRPNGRLQRLQKST